MRRSLRAAFIAVDTICMALCMVAYAFDKWSKELDAKAEELTPKDEVTYIDIECATGPETSLGIRPVRMHGPSMCRGERCVVHSPGDHLLAQSPKRWRIDLQIVERKCEHDTWHPDADDAVYQLKTGRWFGLEHDCECECCGLRLEEEKERCSLGCAYCEWEHQWYAEDEDSNYVQNMALSHFEDAHPDIWERLPRWPDDVPVVNMSDMADEEFGD